MKIAINESPSGHRHLHRPHTIYDPTATVRALLMRELLKMAVDENVSDAVKLAAIRDVLDRAGLSARTAVSVEVGRRPFEVIFDDIVSGSRVESRQRRGMPDGYELDAIKSTHPAASVNRSGEAAVGPAGPIVKAELIEPRPDPGDVPPGSSAERARNAGRRTYTLRDFERSQSGSSRIAISRPLGDQIALGRACDR